MHNNSTPPKNENNIVPTNVIKERHYSEEAKKRMSDANKGRKLSIEHRRKIGAAHKGEIKSLEHRRKLSVSHINKSNGFEGQHLSVEHRQKIRDGQFNCRTPCERRLKRKYGMTIRQWQEMKDKQNNRCAVCNEIFKSSPHVDHNHKTKTVRGLLCVKCNHALGLFKDDIIILNNAIKYINQALINEKDNI